MKFKVGDLVEITSGIYKGDYGKIISITMYDTYNKDNLFNVEFEGGFTAQFWSNQIKHRCIVDDLSVFISNDCITVANIENGAVNGTTYITPELCKSTPELKESLFKKFDNKKPRTDLIHPEFLLELAKVLGKGAEKYGDLNYLNCDDPNRYYAAAMRHLLEWKMGNKIDDGDKGTNCSHLACVVANLMFMFELDNRLTSDE